MQKDHKAGLKNVNWNSSHRSSELSYSRPPVVVSSSSFKRYDLEDREIPSNTISLASIVGLSRFLPAGLKFSGRRKDQE